MGHSFRAAVFGFFRSQLIFALLARGLMPSLKATLTLGGRVDGGISRRPFSQLTEEQHEALKAEYRTI